MTNALELLTSALKRCHEENLKDLRIRPATIMLDGVELPKPVSMGPSWLWFGKSEHTAQRAVYFNTREDRDAVYAKLVEVLGS